MAVYPKGNAWRVVVYYRGQRHDRICRGTRNDALRVEGELMVELFGAMNLAEQSRRHRPCYIYFIQAGDGGPIKIGRAGCVEERLIQIQTDNHEPVKLLCAVESHPTMERTVHGVFAHLNIRGEWFRPAPELLDFISDPVFARLAGQGTGTENLTPQRTQTDINGPSRR